MAKITALRRLDSGDVRPDFDCDDADLNEFFATDSIASGQELMAVTYVAEADGEVVGFFSVSNDSIKREKVPRSKLRRLLNPIPLGKRYSSMPAVKIGRLAISNSAQGQGIGTEILQYLKYWFTHGNKTGCRFMVVDAYNKPRVLKFYQDNEFEFLLQEESGDATRLMYFDLIKFAPAAESE